MKMKMLIAISLLIFFLAACDPAGVLNPTDESTAPTGTTAPSNTKAPDTIPSDTTPSGTTPSDTAPSDTRPAEVAAMDEYFRSFRYNHYNALLELSFDDPRQVSLYVMFNGGFEGEHEPTDAEWAQLKSIPGFHKEMEFFRLPKDKMEAELKKCLGLSLKDMDDSAFEGLHYLESTDCYYFMTTGAAGVIDFYALRLENQSDGTIKMYYTHSVANGECVAVLKEVNGNYQILSNGKVK